MVPCMLNAQVCMHSILSFFILFYFYAFFLFEWWWEDAGNKLIKEVLFATIEFQLDANSQLYFVSRYEYIFIPHLQGILT